MVAAGTGAVSLSWTAWHELGAVWLFVAADCVVSCDSCDTAASNPDVACAMVVASPVSADKVVIVRPTHRARREACQGWEARTATEGMPSGAMVTTDRAEHSMVTGQRVEVTGGVARRRYRAVRSNTGLDGCETALPGSTQGGHTREHRLLHSRACDVQQWWPFPRTPRA